MNDEPVKVPPAYKLGILEIIDTLLKQIPKDTQTLYPVALARVKDIHPDKTLPEYYIDRYVQGDFGNMPAWTTVALTSTLLEGGVDTFDEKYEARFGAGGPIVNIDIKCDDKRANDGTLNARINGLKKSFEESFDLSDPTKNYGKWMKALTNGMAFRERHLIGPAEIVLKELAGVTGLQSYSTEKWPTMGEYKLDKSFGFGYLLASLRFRLDDIAKIQAAVAAEITATRQQCEAENGKWTGILGGEDDPPSSALSK